MYLQIEISCYSHSSGILVYFSQSYRDLSLIILESLDNGYQFFLKLKFSLLSHLMLGNGVKFQRVISKTLIVMDQNFRGSKVPLLLE